MPSSLACCSWCGSSRTFGTAGASFSSIRFRSGAKSVRCRPDVTTPRLLLAGAAVLAVSCVPSPAAAARARSTDRALGRALERLVTMPGGPPGAIAVVQRGRRQKVLVAGVANLDSTQSITADDHMRLASVSKAFNGAAALSLVERGVLSLDDTIGERLPALTRAWAPVTLRHLLNHTSGLPDYLSVPAAQAAFAASLTTAPPPDQLLDFVAGRDLEFKPGSRYRYSNSDNVVVALMIAAATGGSYEGTLRSEVLDPLRLRQTSLPAGTNMPNPYLHGYDMPGAGTPEDLSEAVAAGWPWASGGIISTPRDLNRFIRGYVGKRLFSGTTRIDQMRFVGGGASDPPGPGDNSAGLGIFRYRASCGT